MKRLSCIAIIVACAAIGSAQAAPGDIAWAWTGPTGNNQYACIQRKGGQLTATRKFGSRAEVASYAHRNGAKVRWAVRSSIPCAYYGG